jgi:hypothetical protein
MVILLIAHQAREAFEAWSKVNELDAESLLTDHLNALAIDGICTVEKAETFTAAVFHMLITNPDWPTPFTCKLGSDGKLFYDKRPF